MTSKQLEQAAIDAHRDGMTWTQFWSENSRDVRALEPFDNKRFHRLVRKLTTLVTSGDLDGMTPIVNTWNEPAPWEIDEAADVIAESTNT